MPRRHPPRRNGSAKAAHTQNQQVRIIGGDWRGRRLPFPAIEGLRPTPDRVRETLFNWLQAYVPGANCLDLFAGSGALGLEALSRGARAVTFVDRSPEVVRQLRDNLQTLKAGQHEVALSAADEWLSSREADCEVRYDLVFLDPPFRRDLIEHTCTMLENQGLLRDEAFIYIETEQELGAFKLPANWQEYRSKTAGQVAYRLYRRTSAAKDQA